jgi:eukaryotic-like serine/threonine-protein kinase
MPEIGQSLSHYSLMDKIGKGGMGEVYRAKDQKLGRDVAIKVLPEEFARDADRVARFQREAKLLASLNHPNIAAIYGLEESVGTQFLVLELVQGDTLADRIKAGAIPVEESLRLALQIAEALEAAHEKGIIHTLRRNCIQQCTVKEVRYETVSRSIADFMYVFVCRGHMPGCSSS